MLRIKGIPEPGLPSEAAKTIPGSTREKRPSQDVKTTERNTKEQLTQNGRGIIIENPKTSGIVTDYHVQSTMQSVLRSIESVQDLVGYNEKNEDLPVRMIPVCREIDRLDSINQPKFYGILINHSS